MGGGESRSAEILRYVEGEWTQLGTLDNNVPLMRNRQTDQQAQLHSVILDPKRDIQQEYDIYNYRRKQQKALVGVYAAQEMQNEQSKLCGNQRIVKVLTEHIPVRCPQLPQLPFPDSLYLLSECLTGFNECYQTMGPFEVTPEMIGVNSQGHAKVWLHESHPENHPLLERPALQMTTQGQKSNYYYGGNSGSKSPEATMVQEVVEIVEKKCEGGHFPPDFRARIQDRPTFEEAYMEIEQYCGARNMNIPDRLNLPIQPSQQQQNILQVDSNTFSEDLFRQEVTPILRQNQYNLPTARTYTPPPPPAQPYHQTTSHIPQYTQLTPQQTFQPLSTAPVPTYQPLSTTPAGQFRPLAPTSPRVSSPINFNYSTPQQMFSRR